MKLSQRVQHDRLTRCFIDYVEALVAERSEGADERSRGGPRPKLPARPLVAVALSAWQHQGSAQVAAPLDRRRAR
jgi:hypothetical protein